MFEIILVSNINYTLAIKRFVKSFIRFVNHMYMVQSSVLGIWILFWRSLLSEEVENRFKKTNNGHLLTYLIVGML